MKGLRKEKNKMKFENIKKVNEKLFETIEKTLEEKQFFEFKIKGKIEKFDWLKEASREVKTSKGIKTSKMYVFEKRSNKISSTFFKSRANDETSNACKTQASKLGVNKYMGNPKYNDTNSSEKSIEIFEKTYSDVFRNENISDFYKTYLENIINPNVPLFSKLRPLNISFDTEYTTIDNIRYTICASYSFELFEREFFIIQFFHEKYQTEFHDFSRVIFAIFKILKFIFNFKKIPYRISRLVNKNETDKCFEEIFKMHTGRRLYFQFITHFGRTDLTLFKMFSNTLYKRLENLKLNHKFEYNMGMLAVCKSAGTGGIFSVTPDGNFSIRAGASNGKNNFLLCNVAVRDTMNFTDAKNLSLSSLGKSIGFPKLEMSEIEYDDMHKTFLENPYRFLKYTAADAIITQRYFNNILGGNIMMPATINGLNAKCFRLEQMKVLKEKYNFKEQFKNFDYDFFMRGIEKITDGMEVLNDKLAVVKKYRVFNNDPYFAELNHYAKQSYFGGNNQCIQGYWIACPTIDIDLKSAYPTAEACIYDIDYRVHGKTLKTSEEIKKFNQRLEKNPFMPAFICINEFEFPENIKYPCITQKIGGNIVYVSSKNDCEYLYLTGIEYWSALKMGAKFKIYRIIEPEILKDDNGKHVRTLGYVNAELIKKRKEMVKLYGKGSKQELECKFILNGSYGKIAQGTAKNSSYNALKNEMEDVSGGNISNPYYASYITAIGRAILNLASQEIHELGYNTYSNTTDGLITDLPEEMLDSLQLYGLKKHIQKAKHIFFDEDLNSDIFEIKHKQSSFLNIATRHNIALNDKGILAHGGIKTKFPKDSMEDRNEMIRAFLECKKEGYKYIDNSVPSLRETVTKGIKFYKKEIEKTHKMKYDFKRKPVNISDLEIEFNKNKYKIAKFDTIPYKNIQEYKEYRNSTISLKLIREKKDFEALELKILNKNKKILNSEYKIKNKNFKGMNAIKIINLLRYYFEGKIEISIFNGKTQKEIADILNSLKISEREITVNDIKNAKRKERKAYIPISEISDIIKLLRKLS